MDPVRFDSLTRSLTDAHSRRGALGGLLAGALGLLGVQAEDVAAHNPIKACKKKSGDAKKKCVKKAKKHNAAHASETPPPPLPPPPPAPPPPPPPCTNGIKDGSESDVDCGGTCPRCANGKTCTSRDDCVTSLCVSSTGTCGPCTTGSCGSDATGTCICHFSAGTCIKGKGAFRTPRCSLCPADTFCNQPGADPTVLDCHYRCGGINYCPAGADNCLSDTTTCGNGGKCFQPLGGGPTRCGISAGACGCTSDQQCIANHGAQAFCVQITGPACTCGAGGPTTFCALPR